MESKVNQQVTGGGKSPRQKTIIFKLQKLALKRWCRPLHNLDYYTTLTIICLLTQHYAFTTKQLETILRKSRTTIWRYNRDALHFYKLNPNFKKNVLEIKKIIQNSPHSR